MLQILIAVGRRRDILRPGFFIIFSQESNSLRLHTAEDISHPGLMPLIFRINMPVKGISYGKSHILAELSAYAHLSCLQGDPVQFLIQQIVQSLSLQNRQHFLFLFSRRCIWDSSNLNLRRHYQLTAGFRCNLIHLRELCISRKTHDIIRCLDLAEGHLFHLIHQRITGNAVDHQQHAHGGSNDAHSRPELCPGNIPQIILAVKSQPAPERKLFKHTAPALLRRCRMKRLRRPYSQDSPAAEIGRQGTNQHDQRRCQKIICMKPSSQSRHNIPPGKNLHHDRRQKSGSDPQSQYSTRKCHGKAEADIMKNDLISFHPQSI